MAFGGSTTAFTINWSYFLYDAAKASGANTDFLVLNMGQGGATLREHITLLTEWEPRWRAYFGRKPDALLSLDGTNDMTLSAIAYAEYALKKYPNWNYMSYAYDIIGPKTQMEIEKTPALNAVFSFLSYFISVQDMRYLASRVFPYTLALLMPQSQELTNPKAMEPTEEHVEIPPEVQDKLLTHFETRLKVLNGALQSFGICHLAFLQPMAMESVYPFNSERKSAIGWKTIAYMTKSVGLGGNIGGNYVLEPISYFDRGRALFKKLGKERGGNFIDISDAFYNEKRDLYSDDSIHYSVDGSKIIARTIMKHLAQKGLLNAGGSCH